MKTGMMTLGLICLTTLAQAGVVDGGGVPNPAAKKCSDLGGKVVLVEGSAGQFGLCQLGRGLIEEWTLWRVTDRKERQLAAEIFLEHPQIEVGVNGNPASLYCHEVGGEVQLVEDAQGGQLGVCRFSDNSIIEEWTLFTGPKANRKLARILKKALN